MNKLAESTDHFTKCQEGYQRAIAVANKVDSPKTTKVKLIFLFLDFVDFNLLIISKCQYPYKQFYTSSFTI